MAERSPLLVSFNDFMADGERPRFLPDHVSRIGEGGEAHVDQLPNLRAMAFHVIGKAPAPRVDGIVDALGMGVYALGAFIGDVHLKLMRPWSAGPEQWEAHGDAGDIAGIIDLLLPLSPKASAVREAFLYRVGEFMDIALHRSEWLPAIIAALDRLTNERLTERARAILEIGIDPGAGDLWPTESAGWAP